MVLRDHLPNKMEVDINVFSTTMESGVLRKTDGTLVVAIKSSREIEQENGGKFVEKFMNPYYFLQCMGKSNIFCFGTRKRDNWLLFGAPTDCSSANEEGKS